jgi:hypothetical protein
VKRAALALAVGGAALALSAASIYLDEWSRRQPTSKRIAVHGGAVGVVMALGYYFTLGDQRRR